MKEISDDWFVLFLKEKRPLHINYRCTFVENVLWFAVWGTEGFYCVFISADFEGEVEFL